MFVFSTDGDFTELVGGRVLFIDNYGHSEAGLDFFNVTPHPPNYLGDEVALNRDLSRVLI